ncbi:MAG: tetratricopeptide repeat protein [Thermoguttaceae bacterium]
MSDATRFPFLTLLYQQYLANQDSAAFIRKVSQTYTQGTLERLASHGDAEVRRAAVLALGFVGDYGANHAMGRTLVDDDRTVRMLAENGIRNLWNRAGTQEQSQQLSVIIRLNTAQQYRQALEKATRLIEEAPWFAEAWNQRAVAHFALGEFEESINDCHQALEINPYHFAAASGMGQAYLHLGDQLSALEGFRRALRLNPNLEGARAQVARLTRAIEEK